MEWVVLIIFIGLIVLAVQHWQITLGIALIGGVIYMMHRINKNEEAEAAARRRAEEEAQRKQQAYEDKQRYVHKNLLDYVTTSVTVLESLPEEIKIAESALGRAEDEFSDGAFAPFWDAVENAVTHLARFDNGIKEILSNSDRYKQKKTELDTTPPAFKLNINTLPDASSTADRLRSIVRQAQKNFHFATIYEQRKTNQILVQGFQSLGEALSEMTYRIESSMDAFSQSFSDSISDLATSNRESAQEIIAGVESVRDQLKSDSEAQRDHEEKEREMLDNIQRRRKPFI
jgi:Skp family chaperone for outer membrane proteins